MFIIVSFVGVFIPIIPAVLFLWGSFLLYHFFIDSEQLTFLFWVITTLFTIILFTADLLTNSYFVKKFGGSKRSEWGAIIGVMIGTFVYPPLGMIVLPLLIVLFLEIYSGRPVKEATLASVGALIGFLSGVMAKVMIQAVMVFIFILQILF